MVKDYEKYVQWGHYRMNRLMDNEGACGICGNTTDEHSAHPALYCHPTLDGPNPPGRFAVLLFLETSHG